MSPESDEPKAKKAKGKGKGADGNGAGKSSHAFPELGVPEQLSQVLPSVIPAVRSAVMVYQWLVRTVRGAQIFVKHLADMSTLRNQE